MHPISLYNCSSSSGWFVSSVGSDDWLSPLEDDVDGCDCSDAFFVDCVSGEN